MDKIAIIMATYNGEKYIREQIESILKNKRDDYKLHICDDGSTDNTVNIVGEYLEKFPSKIVLHQNDENLRVVKNFLYWTKKIDAEYYMFSDQDDYWDGNKINDTFNRIKEAESGNVNKPIAVFADAILVNDNLEEIYPSFFKKEKLNVNRLDFYDLLMENKVLGCTTMFNRAVQKLITIEDSEINDIRMHDWWIGLIASAFGNIEYIDKTVIKYRQHSDNQVGASSALQYLLRNLNKINEQRKLLYAIFKQGELFLNIYRELLTSEQIDYLEEFSTFYRKNIFIRKFLFIKNRYRKTGLIRNIGMIFLI